MENAMHGSNPTKRADTIDLENTSVALRLESIYLSHGQGIYTCWEPLRLKEGACL